MLARNAASLAALFALGGCASHKVMARAVSPTTDPVSYTSVDGLWGAVGGTDHDPTECGGGLAYTEVSTPAYGVLVSFVTIGILNIHSVKYGCANLQGAPKPHDDGLP